MAAQYKQSSTLFAPGYRCFLLLPRACLPHPLNFSTRQRLVSAAAGIPLQCLTIYRPEQTTTPQFSIKLKALEKKMPSHPQIGQGQYSTPALLNIQETFDYHSANK
jgi:hypothetical protein